FLRASRPVRFPHSFPTRRSSDLICVSHFGPRLIHSGGGRQIDRGRAVLIQAHSNQTPWHVRGGLLVVFAISSSSQPKLFFRSREDRKSSRLNSSHSQITYAVF